MTDINWNEFPKKGFISARRFIKNEDIRYGITGVPWGKTKSFPYTDINYGYWAVTKTEYSNDLIKINRFYNTVKFRDGIVMHVKTLKSAANFIFKVKDDPTHFFSEEALSLRKEEIAGTKEWFKKRKIEEKFIGANC